MDESRVASSSDVGVPAAGPKRLRSVKVMLFAALLLSLAGILAFAVVREATTAPVGSRTSRPALDPPRPPLTAAEEKYALDLWPIHNEVKASALRMTFGGMAYKLGELDRAGLRARIGASQATYRRAATRVAALAPPASLARVHQMYVDAVRLYERSAAEMVRVADDGRDEHLIAAHPMSMEAGENLLKVGDVLWPNEYKPN
jgi:hypothetical protein